MHSLVIYNIFGKYKIEFKYKIVIYIYMNVLDIVNKN